MMSSLFVPFCFCATIPDDDKKSKMKVTKQGKRWRWVEVNKKSKGSREFDFLISYLLEVYVTASMPTASKSWHCERLLESTLLNSPRAFFSKSCGYYGRWNGFITDLEKISEEFRFNHRQRENRMSETLEATNNKLLSKKGSSCLFKWLGFDVERMWCQC